MQGQPCTATVTAPLLPLLSALQRVCGVWDPVPFPVGCGQPPVTPHYIKQLRGLEPRAKPVPTGPVGFMVDRIPSLDGVVRARGRMLEDKAAAARRPHRSSLDATVMLVGPSAASETKDSSSDADSEVPGTLRPVLRGSSSVSLQAPPTAAPPSGTPPPGEPVTSTPAAARTPFSAPLSELSLDQETLRDSPVRAAAADARKALWHSDSEDDEVVIEGGGDSLAASQDAAFQATAEERMQAERRTRARAGLSQGGEQWLPAATAKGSASQALPLDLQAATMPEPAPATAVRAPPSPAGGGKSAEATSPARPAGGAWDDWDSDGSGGAKTAASPPRRQPPAGGKPAPAGVRPARGGARARLLMAKARGGRGVRPAPTAPRPAPAAAQAPERSGGGGYSPGVTADADFVTADWDA